MLENTKNFLKKLLTIHEYYFYERRIFWSFTLAFLASLTLCISLVVDLLINTIWGLKTAFTGYLIFSPFLPILILILYIVFCSILLQIETRIQSKKDTYLNRFFNSLINLENYLEKKWLIKIILLVITYFIFSEFFTLSIMFHILEFSIFFIMFAFFVLSALLGTIIFDLIYSLILLLVNKSTKEKIINHRQKIKNKETI